MASHAARGRQPCHRWLAPSGGAAPAAESEWAELLAFRHFLRHAYDVELDPARLSVLVERLAQAVAATDPVVRKLLEALS